MNFSLGWWLVSVVGFFTYRSWVIKKDKAGWWRTELIDIIILSMWLNIFISESIEFFK